jgi:hypothetical protein
MASRDRAPPRNDLGGVAARSPDCSPSYLPQNVLPAGCQEYACDYKSDSLAQCGVISRRTKDDRSDKPSRDQCAEDAHCNQQ